MPDDLFGDRLLVIDDEPAIGLIIKRVAQSCGFDVAVMQDDRSFMKTVRQWEPTVIMLDLKLPNTDGIELLRDLAADQCRARAGIAGPGSTPDCRPRARSPG